MFYVSKIGDQDLIVRPSTRFLEKLNLIVKINCLDIHFWATSPVSNLSCEEQLQELTVPNVLRVTKKTFDTLMKEMQASEKDRFVFQEKSDYSQLLAMSVHKVCCAMTFSRNAIIERFDFLDTKKCWFRSWQRKLRRLFWKKSGLSIMMVDTSLHFLTISEHAPGFRS